MKEMLLTIWKIVLGSIILFVISCSTTSSPGISGSETTNGIVVAVNGTTVECRTAPGTRLIVCKANHNPLRKNGYIDTSFVNETGIYTIENMPEDSYAFYAFPNDTSGAVIQGIAIKEENQSYDSTEFDSLIMISGTVWLQNTSKDSVDVYIKGSPFVTKTDTAGQFRIGLVPHGTYVIGGYYRNVNNNGISYSDTLIIDTKSSDGVWNDGLIVDLHLQQ